MLIWKKSVTLHFVLLCIVQKTSYVRVLYLKHKIFKNIQTRKRRNYLKFTKLSPFYASNLTLKFTMRTMKKKYRYDSFFEFFLFTFASNMNAVVSFRCWIKYIKNDNIADCLDLSMDSLWVRHHPDMDT